jgi:hypothetical protein
MKSALELPWSDFKDSILSNHRWFWIYFTKNNHYEIYAKLNDFTVSCRIYKDGNSDQLDFEDNYKNSAPSEFRNNVITQFETDDKRLQLASDVAEFDQNGEAEILVQVPGQFNPSVPSRYMAGGYANIDQYTFGDRMYAVDLVDVDNILGMGANTVITSFCDVDLPSEKQGWRFWASQGGEGEIEIEPIGGFAAIPGGLYIRVRFRRAQNGTATKVACAVWWGVRFI